MKITARQRRRVRRAMRMSKRLTVMTEKRIASAATFKVIRDRQKTFSVRLATSREFIGETKKRIDRIERLLK